MPRHKPPHLHTAERFAATYNKAPPRPPAGTWQAHPEIDAVNHALTIGEGICIDALVSRVVRLVRTLYHVEKEPRFGRNWNEPLFKVALPVTLGFITPGQLWITADTLRGLPKNQGIYFGPAVFYSLDSFEEYRTEIELMWRGPVLIERLLPGLLGAVSIRPVPPPE